LCTHGLLKNEWNRPFSPAFTRDVVICVEQNNTQSSVLAPSLRLSLPPMVDPSGSDDGSQSSLIARTLFESFACPVALQQNGNCDRGATAQLPRHVRLLHLNFEDNRPISRSLIKHPVEVCTRRAHVGTVFGERARLALFQFAFFTAGQLELMGVVHVEKEQSA
jgi:hypothetical protein